MWPRDHSYYARNRWAGALVVDGVAHADNGRKRMIEAVLDAIQGGDAFYCDLDMASRQTQVVSMIHAATCIQPAAWGPVQKQIGNFSEGRLMRKIRAKD